MKDVPRIVTGQELKDLWTFEDKPNLPLLRNHFLGEGILSG